MKMPGFLQNPGVQGLAGAAAFETAANLTSGYTGLNSAIGAATGVVQKGVDLILSNSSAISSVASNPLINTIGTGVSGVGAFMLSDKILGDLGIENKWLKYSLSAIPTVGAIGVGSAAIPYILGGSAIYWAGKHGWKYTGKALSLLGKGAKRLGKGVANVATETVNSGINLVTAPVRGLYKGTINDNFIKPAPIKAMGTSI